MKTVSSTKKETQKMTSCKFLDLKQGSPEWHMFRRNHIGASDAPIIMKKSPWKTPHKLWQEKLGLIGNAPTSAAMQRGIDLEEAARNRFCKLTGIDVLPAVAISNQYDFMAASYDGISTDRKEIVEIKCPGAEDHKVALSGFVPGKYVYQLLQQMVVSGADHIHYFSYKNDTDIALVTLERRDMESEIECLISEERKFWQCVQNLEEPGLEENDYLKMDNVEWNLTVDEYLSVKKQLKELEDKEKSYRNMLIDLSGNQNCMGGGIKLLKVFRKGTVDYAKIPELKNVDLDIYRKPMVESWRFMESNG